MTDLRVPVAVDFELLVLIGGGEFSFGETRAADEFLAASMPVGNSKVAFLPTASGSSEYAGHYARYLQEIKPDAAVANVPIYRGRDNRRQRNLDSILSAGLVYLGGGVTNHLLDTLKESPAEMALRDAASNGTVVAAIGAAASCFGGWTRDMLRGGGPVPAFGWLRGVAVEPGFTPDNDVALRRLMSIPEIELGIGIPAGTALAVRRGGAAQVIGDGKIAVVRRPVS